MINEKLNKKLFNRRIFLPVIIYFQYIFIALLWYLLNFNDGYSLSGILEIISPVAAIITLVYYSPYSLMGVLICPVYIFLSSKIKLESFVRSLFLFGSVLLGLYVLVIGADVILNYLGLTNHFIYPLVDKGNPKIELFILLHFVGNFIFGVFFVLWWRKVSR